MATRISRCAGLSCARDSSPSFDRLHSMTAELSEPDVALRPRRLHVEGLAIQRQAHHPRIPQIDLFAGQLLEGHSGHGARGKVENADVLTFEVHDLLAVGRPLR